MARCWQLSEPRQTGSGTSQNAVKSASKASGDVRIIEGGFTEFDAVLWQWVGRREQPPQ